MPCLSDATLILPLFMLIRWLPLYDDDDIFRSAYMMPLMPRPHAAMLA